MVAGCDRYFQIVRCFRDEDLRADRQPEFTQIDIEMSFIDRDEFFALIEGLMAALFELIGRKVEGPFRRLPYTEAMEKYGSDKPDLRVPLEMRDLTVLGREGSSEILKNVVASGGQVKGLLIPGAGSLSRGQLDKLGEKAKSLGAKGLIWLKKQDAWKSSLKIGRSRLSGRSGRPSARHDADLALLVADKKDTRPQGPRRDPPDLAPRVTPARRDRLEFCWVVDFPLFEWSEEEKRFVSMHHPFTAPYEEDLSSARDEPRQGPGQGLRPGPQRHRDRRRLHPYPRDGRPAAASSRPWG